MPLQDVHRLEPGRPHTRHKVAGIRIRDIKSQSYSQNVLMNDGGNRQQVTK